MQAIAQQTEQKNRKRQGGNRKRKNQQNHQIGPNQKRFNENHHGYQGRQHYQGHQSRQENHGNENWQGNTPLWAPNYQQQTSGPVPLMSIILAPSPRFQLPVAPSQEEVPKPKTVSFLISVSPIEKNIFQKDDIMAILQNLKAKGFLKPSPRTEAEIWGELSTGKRSIRHQTLIDDITTQRPELCKFCGYKIGKDWRSKEHMDHMDEHVQKNLGRLKPPKAVWYPVSFLAPPAPPVHTQACSKSSKGVISSGSKITKCSVCKEKFEEKFDDDEETWRFKDSIKKLGHVVHLGCASEVTEDMEPTQEHDDDIIQIDWFHFHLLLNFLFLTCLNSRYS